MPEKIQSGSLRRGVSRLEGKTDELIAALHSLIEATTNEPGCIRYELNQRDDDRRWITFVEKWKDQKTFDEHCAMPYIEHYLQRCPADAWWKISRSSCTRRFCRSHASPRNPNAGITG